MSESRERFVRAQLILANDLHWKHLERIMVDWISHGGSYEIEEVVEGIELKIRFLDLKGVLEREMKIKEKLQTQIDCSLSTLDNFYRKNK